VPRTPAPAAPAAHPACRKKQTICCPANPARRARGAPEPGGTGRGEPYLPPRHSGPSARALPDAPEDHLPAWAGCAPPATLMPDPSAPGPHVGATRSSRGRQPHEKLSGYRHGEAPCRPVVARGFLLPRPAVVPVLAAGPAVEHPLTATNIGWVPGQLDAQVSGQPEKARINRRYSPGRISGRRRGVRRN